ncbi:flagellar assembly protein FliW [Glaciihabitans sp. dw_435]|uniref:flagellar assembly protein FliW n=1 Tax=Glaciihabitans sp. dw_435 TaxID=2720081 RepID=UPI001BD1FC74|nr:flagellar assembly protein FliW [Glaciihabitans sp. dw_435]
MSAPLTFLSSPLGLEPLVDFQLVDVDDAPGLFSLESGEGARLYVIDASLHLPDYTPTISEDQRDSLGLLSADDASVLVVVNPGDESTTVNLLAPIVLNTATGHARQFILEEQDWPLKAPLLAR